MSTERLQSTADSSTRPTARASAGVNTAGEAMACRAATAAPEAAPSAGRSAARGIGVASAPSTWRASRLCSSVLSAWPFSDSACAGSNCAKKSCRVVSGQRDAVQTGVQVLHQLGQLAQELLPCAGVPLGCTLITSSRPTWRSRVVVAPSGPSSAATLAITWLQVSARKLRR